MRRRGPRGRVALTGLAVSALVITAVALVFRAQPVTSMPRLVLSVGSTFVPLIALAGLLAALLARRVVLAAIGVVLVTATAAIQLNWYYVARPVTVADHAEVRVLSSNLRYGRADPAFFVPFAAQHADVITVAELTEESIAAFTRAGIGEAFPYSHLLPAPGAGGIGLWSRYPLTPVPLQRHAGVTMPASRVRVPGVRLAPLVASVHVYSPVAGDQNTVEDWSNGMAGAKAQLDNFAKAAGPAAVIIGGDYNSTPDMRQFRDLLTNGYRDAVEQIGAGFAPTFRSDIALPPVITIDHVLTRNAAASALAWDWRRCWRALDRSTAMAATVSMATSNSAASTRNAPRSPRTGLRRAWMSLSTMTSPGR